MTPLERLHVSVHRACEKLYEDDIPPLAGQVIVSKCLPPVSCAGESPFYAVTVVGVWAKDRMWTGPEVNAVVASAADGVEAWVKEECE